MHCNDICVIHLVRACNEIELRNRFLTSSQRPRQLPFYGLTVYGVASGMIALEMLAVRGLFRKVLIG
jgi:hypothetical protein